MQCVPPDLRLTGNFLAEMHIGGCVLADVKETVLDTQPAARINFWSDKYPPTINPALWEGNFPLDYFLNKKYNR